MAPSYLEALNPEQREAVLRSEGPLLILAGAGSGKTRVVTSKIAYLVSELGMSPESILAVTFTNKAAGEMRERAARLEPRASGVMIRTFHSFGCWFLRRNGRFIGLDSSFTIYDEDDQTTLLKGAFPDWRRSDAAAAVKSISRAKDRLLFPGNPACAAMGADFPDVYARYEERLKRSGNVDFGDLIALPVRILREFPEIAERVRSRYRAILVDEYQDSNAAQYELLKLLHGENAHLCVVGDDDQSIYRFRGAEVRNILGFPDAFPGTSIVRLVRNYRSTEPILRAAQSVVSRNRGRMGKELVAVRGGGKAPELSLLPGQDEEALYCCKIAERRVRSGGAWSDVAVLYRTNAQSLAFETAMTNRGIPFRVVGSLKFYDREEIKDALSFLSLLANGRDEVSFKRIANKPARGLGEAGLSKVLALADRDGCAMLEALRLAGPDLGAKASKGAKEFLSLHAAFEEALDGGGGDAEGGLYGFVQRVISESGLLELHRSEDEISGTQRAANLEELANAASLYPAGREGLLAFLEAIALDRSRQEGNAEAGKGGAVTLITMHNTKGLEFPVVVVTGLEQGLFPRADDDEEDMEEQRRLFYVAITRAMDELYLCACSARRMRGRTEFMRPSSFLYELPEDMVASLPRLAAAEDPLWKAGQGVYHEEYGAGVVTQSKAGSEGLCAVIVRFQSGLVLRFVPRYDRKLERISE
jgi:DNA helicase II / ATP-dependent DNA helicase PcrA